MIQVAMTWEKLLSNQRQGRRGSEESTIGRSDFQRDFDRIVYCSAFRRLQDKTQVFPLAKSDFVRTRLTHSLEVSCVGRSLGTELGVKLKEKEKGGLPRWMEPGDVGNIVAAACLAHDIGNPPFGHAGESAIAEWFSNTCLGQELVKDLSKEQKVDFEKFEGNAQGFRILTRLQNPHNPGLQLTCAALAAFTKYPRGSTLQCGPLKGVSWKKHGVFQADRRIFDEVASAVGLLRNPDEDNVWCRHPLAYLVEAADDICYRVNDLEDGFRVGHVPLENTKKLLLDSFGSDSVPTKLEQIDSPNDQIGYLRAKTINCLIDQAIGYFLKQSESILHGSLDHSLVDGIPSAAALGKIIDVSKKEIYRSREVLQIEAAGFQVLGGLLENFLIAVNEVAQNGEKKASAKSQALFYLLPPEFRAIDSGPGDTYTRILTVTDYVSGMTDSFAVSLYKQLNGISLPSG